MKACGAVYRALWLIAAIALLPGLAGCPAMDVKAPNGPLETIEAAEIAAQQANTTIDSLTCAKSEWDGERCKSLGRPLAPDRGLALLDKVDEARKALRTATTIPIGGVGDCLGQKRSQVACIAAAKAAAQEAERLARGGK